MISCTCTIEQSGMKFSDMRKTMKAIGAKAAKVGVLASTAARDNSHLTDNSTGKEMTNADVGFENEFGSATAYRQTSAVTGKTLQGTGVPERSFLRVPLLEHLTDREDMIGKGVMSSVTGEDTPAGAAEVLGLAGVQTVQEAFGTGGYGVWPSNGPATLAWKGHDRPLIDTGQLENSITSEVVPA